ncbi:hypothetical protein BDZ94DRAFT_1250870 [Collybia nuda]|uniref:Uncharacterized protein n=1 Tax=Collybia nuda TaxID=64659 RepID=A0A9P6CI17_9AGAR|nr:hypothetical protein BDZ94DRAFT_1250870 [Collybia nuda]
MVPYWNIWFGGHLKPFDHSTNMLLELYGREKCLSPFSAPVGSTPCKSFTGTSDCFSVRKSRCLYFSRLFVVIALKTMVMYIFPLLKFYLISHVMDP